MPTDNSEPNAHSTDSAEGRVEMLAEQVEEMIWMLLDGNLADSDMKRLEQMILEQEPVRRRYLECVQVHADLHDLFGADSRKETSSEQVSILGQLGSILPQDMPGAIDPGAMGMPPIGHP